MNLEKIVSKNHDDLTTDEREYILNIAKKCIYKNNCLNYENGEVSAIFNNSNLAEKEIMVDSFLEMKGQAIDNIKEELNIIIIKEGTKESKTHNLQGNDYKFHVNELNIDFFGNITKDNYIDLIYNDFSLGESSDLDDIKECIREYEKIDEYIEDKLNDSVEENIIINFISEILKERLDRIESFLVKIAPKHNVLSVFSIEDELDERIFVLKVDKKTDLAERRNILTNVTNETLTYCQNNDLFVLFMETSIFIRR